MEVRVLKLGTKCTDRATELDGTLTHWLMNMSGRIEYVFQPKGLTEEGQPVRRMFLCEERLVIKDEDYELVEVPFEILGTKATDKASGFNGMAVGFIRHINGCFHVEIQPAGTIPGKGATPIKINDFDLRSVEGEMITKLSEQEHAESMKTRPSPTDLPERREL